MFIAFLSKDIVLDAQAALLDRVQSLEGPGNEEELAALDSAIGWLARQPDQGTEKPVTVAVDLEREAVHCHTVARAAQWMANQRLYDSDRQRWVELAERFRLYVELQPVEAWL